MVINKVPSKLLEHWNLIKSPNAKILEKALTNDLGQLHQGIGSKTTKVKNASFHTPTQHPTCMEGNVYKTHGITTTIKN